MDGRADINRNYVNNVASVNANHEYVPMYSNHTKILRFSLLFRFRFTPYSHTDITLHTIDVNLTDM